MGLERVGYRSDNGTRYWALAASTSRDLRTSDNRPNNFGPTPLDGAPSVCASAGRLRNGLRCRYVVFRVIVPPVPEMQPGAYIRLVVWRDSSFDDLLLDAGEWSWRGHVVEKVGLFPEYVRFYR